MVDGRVTVNRQSPIAAGRRAAHRRPGPCLVVGGAADHSIAFMFAAYVASVNNDENTPAGCIGLIGAVGSLLFWQQDLRLRAVLRAGTGPLRDVQKAFAERLGIPSLEIVRLTRRPGRRQASTSVLVTAMYVSGFTGSMAGAVYGFLR